MERSSIGRRTVLKGALGAAAAAAVTPLLAACAGSDGDTAQEATSPTTGGGSTPSGVVGSTSSAVSSGAPSGVQLPTYVANSQVKPDLAGTAQGVLNGFYRYPADPIKAVASTPGSGGSLTILQELGTVPVPVSKNKYWQDLNKRLGVELNLTGVPASDYSNKLATTLAGNDLPDCVQFHPLQPAHLPDILSAKFQDLSEFIAGDAVKEYPALAAIQQMTWKNVVYAGGLYGIPFQQGLMSNILITRDDIIKAKGVDSDVKSADDFFALCTSLTDASKEQYAIGSPPNSMIVWVNQMFSVPNFWREEGGKFTSAWEAPEMKDSLNFMIKLWKAGVIQPDAAASGASKMATWFEGGQIATFFGSYTNWSALVKIRAKAAASDPFKNATFSAIAPPKASGGGLAGHYTNNGTYTFAAIKKTNSDRVKEILRVMNYLAAPFGTVEYLANTFGVAGVHYTMQDGNPVPTAQASEVFSPKYLASAPPVLYDPGSADDTKAQYDLEVKEIPLNVQIPTVGLFSETDSEQGAVLDSGMRSLQTDVILGRKSMDDWDAAVKNWQSKGGNQIRKEYEAAFAATQ
jgi:putative aldouronate transport system substrate-binding protein